jgi:hypothetical protein
MCTHHPGNNHFVLFFLYTTRSLRIGRQGNPGEKAHYPRKAEPTWRNALSGRRNLDLRPCRPMMDQGGDMSGIYGVKDSSTGGGINASVVAQCRTQAAGMSMTQAQCVSFLAARLKPAPRYARPSSSSSG